MKLFPIDCDFCGKEFNIDNLQEMGRHIGNHYVSRKKTNMIEEVPITYEELSDHNSKPISKIRGIALTPTESIMAEKINEIVVLLNEKLKA